MDTNTTAARTATITGLAGEPSIREVPQPTFIDLAPWWKCPAWCDKGNNCYGGDALSFGGPAIITSRHHARTVLVGDVKDIDGASTKVSVEVETIEDIDGYPEAPVVTISIPLTSIHADDAERLAHTILAAVADARQPLPSKAGETA
ncbi:hypothetical protein [Dactylosporangium sp. CA-139066]|uniref:hypothetical protein n=1 Tax=Dactylosporangium sp. CA-139066 TaxID=3239930 RepID=UPI003D921D7C